MKLQKMLYENTDQDDVYETVCAVDLTSPGGEYTVCGNAIIDNTIEL